MPRRFTTAAGILALALGALAVVDHGIAALVPLDAALVSPVGVLVLVVGVYAAQQWRSAEVTTAEPPTPETATEYPVPGEEIDELLATIDGNYLRTYQERRRVTQRVTALAVAVLADRGGWTETDARDALEAGSWTDDPHAAAYFAGRYPEWAPLRFRLRERAPLTRVTHSHQVDRAVEAIRAVAAGEVDLPETPAALTVEPDAGNHDTVPEEPTPTASSDGGYVREDEPTTTPTDDGPVREESADDVTTTDPQADDARPTDAEVDGATPDDAGDHRGGTR